MTKSIVFLLDVDNTLLDNDAVQSDYLAEIKKTVSANAAQQYWEIFQEIVNELGYADYFGALQRYRLEDLHDPKLLHLSSYLLDYNFKAKLYKQSIEVINHLKNEGGVALLTDGDVVFQPRKILRSGLWDAVDGKVLVYIHKEKELHQVERVFPAEHYVMVDDKIRILTAIKNQWKEKVTTVFIRQGHYAADTITLNQYPSADISIGQIGELLEFKTDDYISAAMH